MTQPITLVYFLVVGTVLIQISLASHDIINELDEHHGHTVDLGSYVGKHKIPPKVIHITKTVAVKVPVPYPVKVPYHVPYPVEVIKPYPVPVPKYIKVKEQVPIEVPVHSGHSYGGGVSEHASISEYPAAGHEEYSGSQYAGQIIANSGSAYGHEGQGVGEAEQQVIVQHDNGNNYGGQGLQGQYSAQQLIYSSPRFGINAYYSQNGSPDGSNNEKAYKYEANNGSHQEKIENTSSNYSSGSEYNYNQNGQPQQQQQQIQHISNTNVNQQIYTQGSAPTIHQPQFAEAAPGTLQANQEANQHRYNY